jgi:hypothetical protein
VIAALEWRIARSERRLFALNVAVPLVLTGAAVLGGAPDAHLTFAYTLVIGFFGTFGSAIPLVRDAESGLFGRIARTGLAPPRIIAERLAFHAALDLVQLLPSLALLFVIADSPPPAILMVIATAACTLLAANTLGTWAAALGRSIAEAALFATVIALFALHFGGLFRTAPPGTLRSALASFLPFGFLQRSLYSAIVPIPASGADGLQAFAGSLVIFGVTVLCATPLVRGLAKRSGK